MPDAHLIGGQTLAGVETVVRVKAPGGELPIKLRKGSGLLLGLVDPKHVICLLMPPESLSDESLVNWASGQKCG